jgi:hypothetical protein
MKVDTRRPAILIFRQVYISHLASIVHYHVTLNEPTRFPPFFRVKTSIHRLRDQIYAGMKGSQIKAMS